MAAKARAMLLFLAAACCLPAWASIPRGPVVSENSRQGVDGLTAGLRPGLAPLNSLIAPGMRRCGCDERRRSRSTGKERDSETGLDYFGARYLSSAQGRFTSPDWSAVPQPVPYADLSDPQTLNLYGYVRNNPLSKADQGGHCFWDACIGEVSAGVWIAGAATTAVAGYLATPQGKRASEAAITLVTKAVDGLADKLFSKPPPPLPANPDDLVNDHGYTETSHPKAAENGHRTFDNEETGDKVRFDKGKPDAPGHEGKDHYHRPNPNATGKGDQYLDKNGNPVPRGSDPSHLYPSTPAPPTPAPPPPPPPVKPTPQ
jgi:RHS repeat-associated protein